MIKFLSAIHRRLRRPGAAPNRGYRIFTRDFDLTIDAPNLERLLPAMQEKTAAAFEEAREAFEQHLLGWKTRMGLAALESCDRIRQACPPDHLRDATVTLLVDHSGSMRGQNMLLAATIVQQVEDVLSALDVGIEVLGFTTRSWRGGRPYQRWVAAGRPPGPGRLCELLHIIYKPADHPGGADLALMLREDVIKENIDGEALLWAAARLKSQPRSRRLLLVLSDGAPVDDATITANNGTYLVDHLKGVIAELEAGDEVAVAAIGIGHDIRLYYRTGTFFTGLAHVEHGLLSFLEARLIALAG